MRRHNPPSIELAVRSNPISFAATIFLFLGAFVGLCSGADVPRQSLLSTTVVDINRYPYFWKVSRADNSAQLLTLFCRECSAENADVPLISVLRDTLGDQDPQTDRITYVWLLSYNPVNLGRQMLAAVPFFYWRVGEGSTKASPRTVKPLMDLTAPQHRVIEGVGRELIQWTVLDPMTMSVRASTRALQSNQIDYERLNLEEAISYLRQAPVGNSNDELTPPELNTVIARLELRKTMLGGLVDDHHATRLGEEAGFAEEKLRSRNWELLRQCAEKTGLVFEPLALSGSSGQYALLSIPVNGGSEPHGSALGPVWKLLNMRDPWTDSRLRNWHGPLLTRDVDASGTLLPEGDSGVRSVKLIPLGAYSMDYPRMPLLMIDFRDKLHIKRHEMTQRSINEITSGIIGISHFTNWYYYVAADIYDFVASRHGGAMDQAARLDSYSRFRAALALDHSLEPDLQADMERRITSATVNPLEGSPEHAMQIASARFAVLNAEIEDGRLAREIDKQHRAELAAFTRTRTGEAIQALLHDASFGIYTDRVSPSDDQTERLREERRTEANLQLLDSLSAPGTPPEIAYDTTRIQAFVQQVASALPNLQSRPLILHAHATLARLQQVTHDESIDRECSAALNQEERTPLGVVASVKGSMPGAVAFRK